MATYTDAICRKYTIGFRYDNAEDYIADAKRYGHEKYRIVARRVSHRSLYCFNTTTPVRCGKDELIRFIFALALYDDVFAKVDDKNGIVYLTIIPQTECDNISGHLV